MRKFLIIGLGGVGLLVGYSLIKRQRAHAAELGDDIVGLPPGDVQPATASAARLLTLMDDDDMKALINRGINPDDCKYIERGQYRCEHFESGGYLRFTPAKNRAKHRKMRDYWWKMIRSDVRTDKSIADLCKFAEIPPNIEMRNKCRLIAGRPLLGGAGEVQRMTQAFFEGMTRENKETLLENAGYSPVEIREILGD